MLDDSAANQAEDRITLLPQVVKQPLRTHLKQVRKIHRHDLAEGYGRVSLPYALARKDPGAEKNNRIYLQNGFPVKREVRIERGKQGHCIIPRKTAKNLENRSFSKTIRLIAPIKDLHSPYNMRILYYCSSDLH